MLHIIKQIKGSFISLLENKFNGEGFQVFDGNDDGKIKADEISDISKKVYALEENTDELMSKLNNLSVKLGNGSFDNSEQSKDYFNYLVSKYKSIFNKIDIQKDNVSNNIKGTSKVERKKVSKSVKNNNSINQRGIDGLDRADSIITDFENDIIGTNDFISKNIGVYGALNGVFEKKPRTASEAYLKQMIGAKDCDRVLSGIEKKIAEIVKTISDVTPDFIKNLKSELIAMVLKGVSTYALSGGTGFALDLFGIKINEKIINVGKIRNILESEGFDYVSVRDMVVKGENNPKEIERYAKKLAGKHFDKGTERRTTNEVMYRNVVDEKVYKAFAYVGDLFGIESDTSNMNDLLEKYSNASNLKERAKLTQQINTLLYKIKSHLKSNIAKKELKLNKIGSRVLGSFTDEYKELQLNIKDLKRRLKTISNPFQENQDVADHTGDLSRKINGNKSQIEKAIESKSFDKTNNLKPIHKLDVSTSKFGKALPTTLTTESRKEWIKAMETGYVGNKKEGTAISKMITNIKETYNIGDISLKDFKDGIMKGHYLNAEGRKEFKKILSKNLSGTGGGNLNIANFDIFVTKVGGRTIYLKQNCANVQDVTPDALANVYKSEYFTVTAWIKTGHTDAVEKSETHKENHQKEETRTREVEETKYRDETRTRTEHGTEEVTHDVEVPDKTTTGVGDTANENTGTNVDSNAPAGGPNTDIGASTPGHSEIPTHTETVTETIPTTTTVEYTVKVPYIVTRTETYTVMVDNWVDVTTYWTEYIHHKATVDLFGSIAASITSTMTSKMFEDMVCEKAIKAGIPKNKARTGAKMLSKDIKRATSKVAEIDDNNKELGKSVEKLLDNEKYIVKKGDNLSKIARKYKERNISYKDIAKANNIEKPYIIKVGKVLSIPNKINF